MSLRRSIAFLRLAPTKALGSISGHTCTQPPTISRLSSRQAVHRPFFTTTYLQADSDDIVPSTSSRKHLLHQSLVSIHVDADGLYDAALQSIENPTDGYDGMYGKPAIKTYRAFLFPKKEDVSPAHQDYNLKLKAAAGRCARQIDFLVKRHKSHQADWVRHNDLPEEFQRQTFPLILLLDNVRSAFNVGSIFRTADAAGCERVLTTGITPHPNGSGAEKLNKSALGAELVVPSQHFATTQEALEFLRRELPDYQLVGMETTERSIPYTDMSYSTNGTVLVLGNEVTGVDTDLLPMLDTIVEIPMFGAKNSLNIAACAPVVLYEIIRQWQA
jgi:tRNA G18 (ribose-2'-O)-methylase SpoU